jgi:adenine-specific DNA-methyltransferase
MAGYTADHDLSMGRAIEPSCGGGAFISAMIDRLAASCRRHGRWLDSAVDAIWARDIDPCAVDASRELARTTLISHGVSPKRADELARSWIKLGDFLVDTAPAADWVIGNPPYVRLEDVPTDRMEAYRTRWDAMTGRADVYVGFIQAALDALRPEGTLAFICADRWMRNQYGRRLRSIIENGFSVDAVVTLHSSKPFEQRVAAYPAAVAIRRGAQTTAFVAEADGTFGEEGAVHLADQFNRQSSIMMPVVGPGYTASWLPSWYAGAQSWPAGKPDRIARVNDLEKRYKSLGDSESGVQIGIGMTTGADSIYLTDDTQRVEPDRLLPAVLARDIKQGHLTWSGTHLINPWGESGLVDARTRPKMLAYFESHQERLRARHVAERQPHQWYRTIDRPITGLADAPKLLVADLRPRVTPVLEPGGLYPHHNLFWITSTTWDLRVLGGLLLSDYATLFVQTYSPQMSGGALRVTAQYLRRICIPAMSDIPDDVCRALSEAFDSRDVHGATAAAKAAYRV